MQSASVMQELVADDEDSGGKGEQVPNRHEPPGHCESKEQASCCCGVSGGSGEHSPDLHEPRHSESKLHRFIVSALAPRAIGAAQPRRVALEKRTTSMRAGIVMTSDASTLGAVGRLRHCTFIHEASATSRVLSASMVTLALEGVAQSPVSGMGLAALALPLMSMKAQPEYEPVATPRAL